MNNQLIAIYFFLTSLVQGTGLNHSIPFREHYDLNVLTSSFTDTYGCRCEEEAGFNKDKISPP